MAKKIGVGIVGASPERGWAKMAHIPALQALCNQFELIAVSTTKSESAELARDLYGAKYAFTDAHTLAEHPEVDLVVVAVKVSEHMELISAALDANKNVYCEWPLTISTQQAVDIAKRAEKLGVRNVIGLQARMAPAVVKAKSLVESGRIGKVRSVSVIATRGKGADGMIPQASTYTLDHVNAAGLLEVAGGHTLDVVEHMVGGIQDLSATSEIQLSEVTETETGRVIRVTTPDHVALVGTIDNGAVFSVMLHEAQIAQPGTRIQISGSEGDLLLTSSTAFGAIGLQVGELQLKMFKSGDSNWSEVSTDDELTEQFVGVGELAVNVGRMYLALAADLASSSLIAPNFSSAVRVHRILDAIRRSSETGTLQRVE